MTPLSSLATLSDGPPVYLFGTGPEARALYPDLLSYPLFSCAGYVAPSATDAIGGVTVWALDALRSAVGTAARLIIALPPDEIDDAARRLASAGFHNLFDPRPLYRLRALSARLVPPDGRRVGRLLTVAADFIRLPPSVFLYGAGCGGQLVREAAEAAGRQVIAIVDSFRTGTLDGLPVLAPADLAAAMRPDTAVVVASQYRSEIAERLASVRITDFWDASPFVATRQRRLTWAPLKGCAAPYTDQGL